MSDATCNCPEGECPGETAAGDFLSDLQRYDHSRQCDEICRKLNEFQKEPDEPSRIHDPYPTDCQPKFVLVLQEALEQGC